MARKITGVDYLVVGFPKCGTTTLHDLLWRYSDCRLPKVKETHFLNNYNLDSETKSHEMFPWGNGPALPSIKNYKKAFRSKTGPVVEITPSYIFKLKRVMNNHKEIFGSLPSLLVMLRDPIDAATSHYRMMLRNKIHNFDPHSLIMMDEALSKSGSYRMCSISCFKYETYIPKVQKYPHKIIDAKKFLSDVTYSMETCRYITDSCDEFTEIPKSNVYGKGSGLTGIQKDYVKEFQHIAETLLKQSREVYNEKLDN